MRSILIGCTLLAFGSCAALAQTDPSAPATSIAPNTATPTDATAQPMAKGMAKKPMMMKNQAAAAGKHRKQFHAN